MKSIWELGIKDLVSPAVRKIQGSVKQAFAAMEQAEHSLSTSLHNTSEQMSNQESVLGSLRRAAIEYFSISKFGEIGQDRLTSGMNMERLRVEMQTLTGTAETGNTAFEK